MKITALTILLGSAGVVGCAHEMPHHEPSSPHHESAVRVDHHEAPVAWVSDHHDVPAHHVVGAVDAEGTSPDDAVSHLQSRAAAIGADRVIEVVTEPAGGGRFRARGRAIRTTH